MRQPRNGRIPGRIMVCALILAGVCLGAQAAAAYDPPREGPEGRRTMMLLSTETLKACTGLEAAVEAAGGRVVFVFRPSMVVAFLPEGATAQMAARPEVLLWSSVSVPPLSLGHLSREQQGALAIWNGFYMGQGAAGKSAVSPVMQAPPRGYADGLAIPQEYRTVREKIKGYGAGDLSTSEYMLLDGPNSKHQYFHVNFVFPESNGAIDASTENWTTQMMSDYMTACVAGLEWWFDRYAPARMALVIATTWQVNIAYEPINHPHTYESTWVDAVMNALGYAGANYFYKVRNFDNHYLVGANETWFNTIFVVNSLNDADGCFTDAWFDYSYFGGPFTVMTWDNDNWGNANTDYLCAHETGHTFYALDEYATSGCTRSQTSGYLNIYNSNCENGGSSVECIMRNNNRVEFTNGSACAYTRNAIGWRDSDSDDIPDILDHPPMARFFQTSGGPGCSDTQGRNGVVDPETQANANPLTYVPSGSSAKENISVNSVRGAEVRLNGGAWQAVSPDDGVWDEAEEFVSPTFGLLKPIDANIVEIRAWNSRGLTSAVTSDTLYYWPCVSWCDGFEDGDLSDWTIVNAGATISLDNTVAQGGAWSLKVTGAASEGQYAMATSPAPGIDFTEPYTIRFWYRWSSFHWDQWAVFGHVRLLLDQPGLPLKYDPNGDWSGLTNLGSAFQTYIPQNSWKSVVISVTPAARQYTVFLDDMNLGTVTYAAGLTPSSTLWFMDNPSGSNFQNAWYDSFCIDGYRLAAGVMPGDGASGTQVGLLGGRPNPFGRTTTISYEAAEAGPLTLEIYSVAGVRMRTLLHDVSTARGRLESPWDGKDDAGRMLPRGVYFARVQAKAGSASEKLILLE